MIFFTSSASASIRVVNSGKFSLSRYVPGVRLAPRYNVSGQGSGTISIPNFLHRSIQRSKRTRSEGFVIPSARNEGLRMHGAQSTYIDTVCARTDDQ